MTLSIIIPVYNEKDTILKTLKQVEEVDLPLKKEIIIVDDYSTDGTKEILKGLIDQRRPNLKIIFKEKNGGKGSAIKEGFFPSDLQNGLFGLRLFYSLLSVEYKKFIKKKVNYHNEKSGNYLRKYVPNSKHINADEHYSSINYYSQNGNNKVF